MTKDAMLIWNNFMLACDILINLHIPQFRFVILVIFPA